MLLEACSQMLYDCKPCFYSSAVFAGHFKLISASSIAHPQPLDCHWQLRLRASLLSSLPLTPPSLSAEAAAGFCCRYIKWVPQANGAFCCSYPGASGDTSWGGSLLHRVIPSGGANATDHPQRCSSLAKCSINPWLQMFTSCSNVSKTEERLDEIEID